VCSFILRQPFSPVERRKSTVRKPFFLSAKPANDFENRPVHEQKREADYEWKGCFGKRAPISGYRFIVSSDGGVSPRPKMVAPGTSI
jgi:hypothetical protein